MSDPGTPLMERTRDRVRKHLEAARDELTRRGLPEVPIRGKLLRPLFAWAATPAGRREELSRSFWMGALAVQMVHEASLLHDDILDGAPTRRGRATEAAQGGIAAALVGGDHLLTAAYRAALETEDPGFVRLFVEAVERTVAGEAAQGRSAGRPLGENQYLEMLEHKSGALFGCAMALGPSLLGQADVEARVELGRRVGRLYQLVDDVLDYCPESERGKPAFQDYRQGKWTLPLGALGRRGELGLPVQEIHHRLFSAEEGERSSMTVAVDRLRLEVEAVLDRHALLAPGDRILSRALDGWISRLAEAVEREEEAVPVRTSLARDSAHLDGPEGWSGTFGRHATTFSFAARLFPAGVRRTVAGVYAFCRFSDDLVDGDPHGRPQERRSRLATWRAMARAAHQGRDTGVGLLDRVLGDAARRGVPFRVVDALLEGMGWDLESRRYADMEELGAYTYRVAGTVGEWITCVLGCSDEAILERARSLGHAMQLTNILRDVGEDYRMGRIYLPRDRMAAHGIRTADLDAMVSGRRPVLPAYRALVEELLQEAEAAYDDAVEGIPALPRRAGETIAVAARAYRGIHREIRRNGYDNLTRRAFTSLPRKVYLAARALVDLRTLRRRNRQRAAQLTPWETPEPILVPPAGERVPA